MPWPSILVPEVLLGVPQYASQPLCSGADNDQVRGLGTGAEDVPGGEYVPAKDDGRARRRLAVKLISLLQNYVGRLPKPAKSMGRSATYPTFCVNRQWVGHSCPTPHGQECPCYEIVASQGLYKYIGAPSGDFVREKIRFFVIFGKIVRANSALRAKGCPFCADLSQQAPFIGGERGTAERLIAVAEQNLVKHPVFGGSQEQPKFLNGDPIQAIPFGFQLLNLRVGA